MKQIYNTIKDEEKVGAMQKNIKGVRASILTVLSLSFCSLFLFFAVGESSPKKDIVSDEIVSVFKETYLYDFLDLENCENIKTSRGVSEIHNLSSHL